MKKIYLQIQFVKNKMVKAYILNLSKSGMGIAAMRRLRKGLIVNITSKIKLLPRLEAEIIYTSKLPRKRYNYRTGVKFVNLNQKQQSGLGKFIHNVAKRQR